MQWWQSLLIALAGAALGVTGTLVAARVNVAAARDREKAEDRRRRQERSNGDL
jgi:hypothetical protein